METPVPVSGAGDVGDSRSGVDSTDTQRMLFHVPDGASGTLDRSVGAEMAVADGDRDSNADAVSAALARGRCDGEPVAVAATQPAATNAMSATSAPHLRQPRLLPNLDSTACPPEDHPSVNASVTPLWKAV
jgi:hypothetical protein